MLAMILLDISNLSASLQAGAAIALVILTGWTLVVLRRYAADTATIAKVSASQTENSQMPFLAVARMQHGWVIKNQGFGPAINVLYSGGDYGDRARMMSTESLGASDEIPLQNVIANAFARWNQFDLEYQSLSGRTYKTTITMNDNQLGVQFQKPAA